MSKLSTLLRKLRLIFMKSFKVVWEIFKVAAKAVAIQITKEMVDLIRSEIIRVAEMDVSPEKKFELVFKFGKGLAPKTKDSVLNAFINTLYLKLKDKNELPV